MLGLDELARTAWLDLIPDLEGSVLLCDTAGQQLLQIVHYSNISYYSAVFDEDIIMIINRNLTSE